MIGDREYGSVSDSDSCALGHADARSAPPPVSVVTVVKNSVLSIEATLESVIGQSYPNIDFIVIDGCSTDGTVGVIQKYSESLGFWSSEPDSGIYDAMNKGVGQARGEWVLFLNAGDVFAADNVLAGIAEALCSDAEIIYGNHQEIYRSGHCATRPARAVHDLWKGMVFSHQAVLMKTSLLRQYPFNVASSIAADYELIYKLYHQGRRFHRVPLVIARVPADGFSASRNIRLTLDQWRIARHYSGRRLVLDGYYAFTVVRIAFNNILKAVLPARLVDYLRSR